MDGTKEITHYRPVPGSVVLDQDVCAYFPNSDAVNAALRGLIALIPAKRRAIPQEPAGPRLRWRSPVLPCPCPAPCLSAALSQPDYSQYVYQARTYRFLGRVLRLPKIEAEWTGWNPAAQDRLTHKAATPGVLPTGGVFP